jgi:ubiquinone/menaquinone biosynthesis C-methylase UbiE
LAPAESEDELGYTPQHWDARHSVARDVFVPWLEANVPLADKTVLEYGSGNGAVSCAVAARAARHIGLDIEQSAIDEARVRARERGLENLELEVVGAEAIFDRVRAHTGEVDVFLFYAVLEHLTLQERLEALRLAREVVRSDGLIAVIELPNRLVDTDYHTSLLPFFDQLPPELALAYLERSPRADFRQQMLEARAADSDGGVLALARWGTGASFHEFELVFGDLSRHVIGGGYDPMLLAERTVHADETALARYLEGVRPDLPPPFSPYWIDVLISPTPIEPSTTRLIRPWPMETRLSRRAGWTRSETIELPRRRLLRVEAPAPTQRVVCTLSIRSRRARLTLRAGRSRVTQGIAGPRRHPLVAEFPLERPVSTFTLEVSEWANFSFVGFELSGSPAPA